MPAGYEKMRDKFRRGGMTLKRAKGKAARIWNSKNPGNPVTRAHKALQQAMKERSHESPH